ncbi:MAG: hypothetical protein FJ104_05635 [Deltaproteobacteria bacterium]|nr:hypothetical protein [Deltaproteobacteria bacterium]
MPNTDPAFVRDLTDDKIEALVEMMYLAATADGSLDEPERVAFHAHAERLTASVVTGARLEALLARIAAAVETEGRDARLEGVKARLPDASARRLALALAIQISAADGVVRTSERELVMETAAALEIDGDTAADMMRDLTRR